MLSGEYFYAKKYPKMLELNMWHVLPSGDYAIEIASIDTAIAQIVIRYPKNQDPLGNVCRMQVTLVKESSNWRVAE
jgi:hypothetical protein